MANFGGAIARLVVMLVMVLLVMLVMIVMRGGFVNNRIEAIMLVGRIVDRSDRTVWLDQRVLSYTNAT